MFFKWWRRRRPRYPGILRLFKLFEMESFMLRYKLLLPEVTGDVLKQHVVIKVDDVVVDDLVLELDVRHIVVEVKQDSVVNIHLTHIDDAGNVSVPSVLDFVAKDTIAPPKPGDVVIDGVEEL